MDRIVVVGASLAGVRTAEALRRDGYPGALTLVGDERHFPPYDRPPLSKEILSGAWEPERARLRVADDLHAELLLGVRAIGLDLDGGSVRLDDGSEVVFDGLVVATGATPRMLPNVSPTMRNVFVLRTFEDCIALRTALSSPVRVVVVGAGFIGAEVAAVCRGLGHDVTVIEPLEFPLVRALGPELGAWAAKLHRDHGVDLRLGIGVSGIVGTESVEAVLLHDGSEVPADVVVVAVGVEPATAWLEGSGLELDNGLVLDETCMANGTTNVVGVGDVARWFNPLFGRLMRIEHWSNAGEQADVAAHTLLAGPGAGEPFAPVPYFWSDQYDRKIQYVGIAGTFSSVVIGSLDEERFVATFELDGRLVGALCVNSPRDMVRFRRLVAASIGIDEVEGALA